MKDKTTTIIEKNIKTFSFRRGTVGPHDITIFKGRNDIGLEVKQKKGFRKKP